MSTRPGPRLQLQRTEDGAGLPLPRARSRARCGSAAPTSPPPFRPPWSASSSQSSSAASTARRLGGGCARRRGRRQRRPARGGRRRSAERRGLRLKLVPPDALHRQRGDDRLRSSIRRPRSPTPTTSATTPSPRGRPSGWLHDARWSSTRARAAISASEALKRSSHCTRRAIASSCARSTSRATSGCCAAPGADPGGRGRRRVRLRACPRRNRPAREARYVGGDGAR